MKTIKMSAVLAVAFTGMFAGAARAQERVVVNGAVPVRRARRATACRALRRHHRRRRALDPGNGQPRRMFALTQPADGRDPAGDEPALVFVRYENQNLLSQIWGSETEGLALPERADHSEARPRRCAAQSSIVFTSGVEATRYVKGSDVSVGSRSSHRADS